MVEWLLDIRSREEFALGHLLGAINIPLGPSFRTWVEVLIPSNIDLCIIHDDKLSPQDFSVYIQGLPNTIRHQAHPKDNSSENIPLATLHVEDLLHNAYYILDVRSAAEWERGHLPQAHHIPLTDLLATISQIPKNQYIACICGSGYRSAIAASILQREGYPQVANILGGMQAAQRIEGKIR